jgi:hypothetical protein
MAAVTMSISTSVRTPRSKTAGGQFSRSGRGPGQRPSADSNGRPSMNFGIQGRRAAMHCAPWHRGAGSAVSADLNPKGSIGSANMTPYGAEIVRRGSQDSMCSDDHGGAGGVKLGEGLYFYPSRNVRFQTATEEGRERESMSTSGSDGGGGHEDADVDEYYIAPDRSAGDPPSITPSEASEMGRLLGLMAETEARTDGNRDSAHDDVRFNRERSISVDSYVLEASRIDRATSSDSDVTESDASATAGRYHPRPQSDSMASGPSDAAEFLHRQSSAAGYRSSAADSTDSRLSAANSEFLLKQSAAGAGYRSSGTDSTASRPSAANSEFLLRQSAAGAGYRSSGTDSTASRPSAADSEFFLRHSAAGAGYRSSAADSMSSRRSDTASDGMSYTSSIV